MKDNDLLNNLTITDLHQLLMGIAAISNDTNLSEEASEWAIGLHNTVEDAFFAATAVTPIESLLKLITLGEVDINNSSIFGPDALTEAKQLSGWAT